MVGSLPRRQLRNAVVIPLRLSTSSLPRRQRENLRQAIPVLIEKWQPRLGVRVNRFYVQRMKTRWGSCSYPSGNIRLNTELAKKPLACLEYIVVHENDPPAGTDA